MNPHDHAHIADHETTLTLSTENDSRGIIALVLSIGHEDRDRAPEQYRLQFPDRLELLSAARFLVRVARECESPVRDRVSMTAYIRKKAIEMLAGGCEACTALGFIHDAHCPLWKESDR